MTVDDKIRDENLQYNIKLEAANIPALSSGKIDKREYLTCEEILTSDQSRMIEKAMFIVLLYEKHSKNKQKQLEIKVKYKER